jgi:hypothetical protein
MSFPRQLCIFGGCIKGGNRYYAFREDAIVVGLVLLMEKFQNQILFYEVLHI